MKDNMIKQSEYELKYEISKDYILQLHNNFKNKFSPIVLGQKNTLHLYFDTNDFLLLNKNIQVNIYQHTNLNEKLYVSQIKTPGEYLNNQLNRQEEIELLGKTVSFSDYINFLKKKDILLKKIEIHNIENLLNKLNIIQKRWKYKLLINKTEINLSFDIGKYIVPNTKKYLDFSMIEIEYNSNEEIIKKNEVNIEKIIEPLSILDFGRYTKFSKYETGVRKLYDF